MARTQPSNGGKPSRLLAKSAHRFSREHSVLDAGCGAGRNALALASLGFNVVCVDQNQHRLDQLRDAATELRLNQQVTVMRAALDREHWPFREAEFSAVVCVHYLDMEILPKIQSSLAPGGHLYIETFGGQGENHRELPVEGELRDALSHYFYFDFYQERPVGPTELRKRAVKMLGRKTA